MAKKNNVIEEIQELIQQIKKEYQEGVDYKTTSSKEMLSLEREVLMLNIISSKLKKYCRSQIGFPVHFPDGLSYYLGNQEQDPKWFFYQTEQEVEGSKIDTFIFCEGIEASGSRARGRFEKCDFCGESVDKKKGRLEQWNQSRSILASFHPECAKKYFGNKEQPNQNDNARIKEKLLRNLDKICLDPEGYLANNEYLKTDQAEKEYHQAFNSNRNNWVDRYLKITIEGEEINLEKWDNCCEEYYEVKRELIKKIKSEIKQNPSEWKIERAEVLPGLKYDNEDWLVKHQSGRRYWKWGISNMRGKQEWKVEGKQDWPEIEALINGSQLPDKNNQPNNSELEKLKKIFREHNIKKMTFENNQLTIEYDNEQKKVNNSEFQELKKYCQEHEQKEITRENLNLGSNNNSNSTISKSSRWENKYLWLAGGITLGVIISVILVSYCRRKRKIK